MINESKGHKLGAKRKGSPENEKRRFSVTTWQEGHWWVAQALEVDIASQGETEQEALDNLKEALELHFEFPNVSQKNALTLLEKWMSEPDDKGDAWWDEFEEELRQNRFTLREIELDE